MSGAPSPARDLRAHTPKPLADKIIGFRPDLEGERKPVTLLAADIRAADFARDPFDPAEWVPIRERFLQILADGIHRFDGVVTEYSSDGLVAFFGAPIPHEDNAQRACFGALQISRELRVFADDLRRTKSLNLSGRVALHSGEITVVSIGDDLVMAYSESGGLVELGSSVVQLVEPGRIYLTDRTSRDVEGLFKMRHLGAFELGGGEPTRLYELQSVSSMRTRVNASRAQSSARFIERRLVGIFNADVVGYSYLMADDEVATVVTLTAYREIMSSLIEQHRGRVVDFPGDNLLGEFPTAGEAVRCAMETQRALRLQNDALPPGRRMEFRIGVHLAEVMVEGDRLYGDGINVAARVERLAEAGGVCVSGRVYDQIRDEFDVAEDLGEQLLKNIPQPTRVYRLRRA